jgi:hypothetical protein
MRSDPESHRDTMPDPENIPLNTLRTTDVGELESWIPSRYSFPSVAQLLNQPIVEVATRLIYIDKCFYFLMFVLLHV